MEEKKELKSGVTISKSASFKDHTCILGLDKKREKEFNSGKSIEVTKDELNKIGSFRWLEIKNGN